MPVRSLCRVGAFVGLLLVCLIALASPLYNRVEPRLFGWPFFAWFQLLWIVVAAVVTGLVYRLTRVSDR